MKTTPIKNENEEHRENCTCFECHLIAHIFEPKPIKKIKGVNNGK